jgi:hypothetical protein
MEPTQTQILEAVLQLQDRVNEGRGEALTADDVSDAVARGIRTAVSDPSVWSAALLAMQSHAKTEAGGWLLGGIKAALSRMAWVVIIGLSVYMVGGWAALAALFKSGAHT